MCVVVGGHAYVVVRGQTCKGRVSPLTIWVWVSELTGLPASILLAEPSCQCHAASQYFASPEVLKTQVLR